MPNKELLQKWVAWLRDPSNEQCKSMLCWANTSHCCLGGLAKVMGYGFVPDDYNSDGTPYNNYYKLLIDVQEPSWRCELPPDIWELLDISEEQTCYTDYNDIEKWSFAQIADHIEEMYLRDHEGRDHAI